VTLALQLIGYGTLAAVLYGLWVWFFPHASCRRCSGRKGQGLGSTKYRWSRCRRCGGSGERVRIAACLISKATGLPVRGTKQ
jgi:hypothetical protein